MSTLPNMLVKSLEADLVDVSRMGDRHPVHWVGTVTATLVGHGVTMQRSYELGTEPRIGERIDVDLDEELGT